MRKYARVYYDDSKDSFVIELFDNETETWGFSSSYKCVRGINSKGEPYCINGEEPSTDFVHHSLLNQITQLVNLGWCVNVSGVPMALPND